MHPTLTRSIIALCLSGALAMPASALELFGKDCLQKLSTRTRIWAECSHKFTVNDARCKMPKFRMHQAMQHCEGKGYSKGRIDAAMAEGARSAGSGDFGKDLAEPAGG